MKAAVIDLGFNSVKMVCYNVDSKGRFNPYRQEAFKARLGEGLGETGYLGEAQIRRTLDYLKVLCDIAKMEGISTVLPVATSAVRDAANRDEFLHASSTEAGLSFRVLAAKDEALYSFAGALGFSPTQEAVFFDLGGGSLEVVWSSNFRIKKAVSLPLGALRLSYEFGDGGALSKQEARKLKKHILELLPSWLESSAKRARLVGVGGTVRALARYEQELTEYPFSKIQSYRMAYKSINELTKSLIRMSPTQLEDTNAIGNRSDSIAAGALVVKTFAKYVGARELTVSSYGLREGTLSMYLRDRKSFHSGLVSNEAIERLVKESAEALRMAPESNPAGLEKAGLLTRREAFLLYEAYRLVSHAPPSTNLRSFFYSILEQDSVVTHAEQLAIATLVVATRNNRAAESFMEEFKELMGDDGRRVVVRLGATYAFLETLERAGVRAKLSRRARYIDVIALEGKAPLPMHLLEFQAEAMAEQLGLGVTFSYMPATAELVTSGRSRP